MKFFLPIWRTVFVVTFILFLTASTSAAGRIAVKVFFCVSSKGGSLPQIVPVERSFHNGVNVLDLALRELFKGPT